MGEGGTPIRAYLRAHGIIRLDNEQISLNIAPAKKKLSFKKQSWRQQEYMMRWLIPFSSPPQVSPTVYDKRGIKLTLEAERVTLLLLHALVEHQVFLSHFSPFHEVRVEYFIAFTP